MDYNNDTDNNHIYTHLRIMGYIAITILLTAFIFTVSNQ